MNKRIVFWLIAALTLALAPLNASAILISSTQLTAAELGAVTTQNNPLFDSSSGVVFQNVAGSEVNVRRSPFDTADPDPWNNRAHGLYTSVSGGAAGTYTFDQVQSELSMIWGSPDTYNSLELLLGDSLTPFVIIIPGTTIGAPPAPQLGAWQFTVSDTKFDRVVFKSGQNAFEFANFTTVAVPEPGTLALLGMGLLALAGLRRKLL